MKRLFINYRQSDTKPTAQRLCDELKRRLVPDKVFLDEQDIRGGEEWPERLREELAKAQVVFALIGKDWLGAKKNPDSEHRRLDEPGDWVRRELEEALARHKERNIKLVPVRVDNAAMPEPSQLPESLQDLPKLKAEDLRNDKDWNNDVGRLADLFRSYDLPSQRDLRQQMESEEACRAVLSHRACCWAAQLAQLISLIGLLYLPVRAWSTHSVPNILVVAATVCALALLTVAMAEVSTYERRRIGQLRYLCRLGRH